MVTSGMTYRCALQFTRNSDRNNTIFLRFAGNSNGERFLYAKVVLYVVFVCFVCMKVYGFSVFV